MIKTFKELIDRPVAWLSGEGDESGMVLSSRVRLARNIGKHSYPVRAEPEEAREIVTFVKTAVEKSSLAEGGIFLQSDTLSESDRDLLVERHLISPEFMRDEMPRGLYVDDAVAASLMVNEEDHLRIQAVRSGLDLKQSMDRARSIEMELSERLNFDYEPRLGYLTACPTNVGTGLRVSVLIHLPGLALTKEMDRVLGQMNKVGLTVRGFYGEGSEVLGYLFQVSNQTTLGRTEEDVLDSLEKVTRQLIAYESNAREALVKDASHHILDKIWRSYGILTNARVLTSQEVMNLLSAVRLGVAMGENLGLTLGKVSELMLATQPAHLQRAYGKEMSSEARDVARAELVRQHLGGKRKGRRRSTGGRGKRSSS